LDSINLRQPGDDYLYDNLRLDGLSELRKIVKLVSGHAMDLYKAKKVAEGFEQYLFDRLVIYVSIYLLLLGLPVVLTTVLVTALTSGLAALIFLAVSFAFSTATVFS